MFDFGGRKLFSYYHHITVILISFRNVLQFCCKDFDKLCTKHLNGNDARTVIEAAHHLSINGIQVVQAKKKLY